MSEKRFYRASVCGDEGLYDKEDGCIIVNVRSNIDLEDNWNTVVEKLNELAEGNEQLKKKIKPSIYNKKDGDWKWNVDNNTILNIRTGEIFYLRNSGAVENLVHLLNKLEQILSENEKMLQKDLDMLTELRRENEQLRMKLKGDDYIMVSEILSNLRKTGICDGCKNKDKPVEWYLERGFSITGQICDRYEPE